MLTLGLQHCILDQYYSFRDSEINELISPTVGLNMKYMSTHDKILLASLLIVSIGLYEFLLFANVQNVDMIFSIPPTHCVTYLQHTQANIINIGDVYG